jgi:hypothetical protein
MDKPFIALWRNVPVTCRLSIGNEGYPSECIFPSARQALKYGLRQVGLSRPKRIALPEWSSGCVISAVGEVATPIPIKEVLEKNIPVDAVLFYEQWGWQMPVSVKSKILERFRNSIIIIDRVDSADINSENRLRFYPEATQLDVISLWKILGLRGGGIIKLNGKYLYFKPSSDEKELSSRIWENDWSEKYSGRLLHIHKSYIEALHPGLIRWFAENDLEGAFHDECLSRRKNLSVIANSELSSNWGKWMFDALDNKNAPGIVPLFRGYSRDKMKEYQRMILTHFNIETSICHYNWSGNPMNPNYEINLAFPIHGLINSDLEDAVKILIRRR